MKKIFCLITCLALVLSLAALVSCDGNSGTEGSSSSVKSSVADNSSTNTTDSSKTDSTVDSSTTDSSTTDSSTTDSSTTDSSTTDSSTTDSSTTDSSTTNSSTTDSSTTDSSTTDSSTTDSSTTDSSTTDSSTTDSSTTDSSTTDSGTTDSSTTDSSKPEDDGGEDVVDKITVSFVCYSGTHVSGDMEIKIDKGSSISVKQLPVITRDGYVLGWSYDMFGDEPWSESDVFDEDTELFGKWHKRDDFDDLIGSISGFDSFCVNSVISNTVGNEVVSYTSVEKYDGDNAYSLVEADDTREEAWYVDGIFYAQYGDIKMKSYLSKAEYVATYGSPFGVNEFFGVKRDEVISISKNGNTYNVVIDAAKYTERLASTMPIEIIYTSITYTVELDGNGQLVSVGNEYTFAIDGVTTKGSTVSEITGVGETVVAAPTNADEFAEMH